MYSRQELALKRLFDVAVAVTGLAVASPALLVIGLLVKVSSPGAALFRQRRVGRHGRVFWLLKFRTMVSGDGPLVTAQGDPRVTTVGRALRRSKLDELPGLLNVVMGDLSLVGPRPEVPKYVAHYPAADRELLQRYRPGITDPATVQFRNEEQLLAHALDPEELYLSKILPTKLRLYREYLEEATFISDFRILAQTVAVIVAPELSRPAI